MNLKNENMHFLSLFPAQYHVHSCACCLAHPHVICFTLLRNKFLILCLVERNIWESNYSWNRLANNTNFIPCPCIRSVPLSQVGSAANLHFSGILLCRIRLLLASVISLWLSFLYLICMSLDVLGLVNSSLKNDQSRPLVTAPQSVPRFSVFTNVKLLEWRGILSSKGRVLAAYFGISRMCTWSSCCPHSHMFFLDLLSFIFCQFVFALTIFSYNFFLFLSYRSMALQSSFIVWVASKRIWYGIWLGSVLCLYLNSILLSWMISAKSLEDHIYFIEA